jgi:DNA repair protein RecN (Recombination protein N)
MLLELRIENLLLIERAELRLGRGLNAITGETGAGKTILAHSLDLIMGGKARRQIVRPGASEAYVEVFRLPEEMHNDPDLTRSPRGSRRTPATVLGRRETLPADQRLRSGLTASAPELQASAAACSPLRPARASQLTGAPSSDSASPAWSTDRRRGYRDAHAEVIRLAQGCGDPRARGGQGRDLDILRYELEEIETQTRFR